MFKKTLTAVALAAAFGSASAGDVTLYGRMDLGLSYNNITYSQTDAKDIEADSFTMDSGNSTGSRFGIKGTEELGNGLTVGFVLENGFKADTGTLGTDKTIFDREASLSLSGSFGTVYAGRLATVYTDSGSVGIYGTAVSPFGTGWGNVAGHTTIAAAHTSRYNNSIAYVSPTFAGTQVFAQYAMGDSSENTSKSDRYAALGAIYSASGLTLAGMVDWNNRASFVEDADEELNKVETDDMWSVNLGGSYDCGAAKTYVSAQYFKNAPDVAGIISGFDTTWNEENDRLSAADKAAINAKGWSATVGADIPMLGGLGKIAFGYTDADVEANNTGVDNDFYGNADIKVWNVTAGYQYNLSKRTSLYAGAGYIYREFKDEDYKTSQDLYQVMAGLVHKF